MGRRPNAIILQYFTRGPKLQDNSNRYPHTCKLCGEFYAKGRIDSLTNHLTKKCPAISEADRVHALLTLSNLSHASHQMQQAQHVADADLPPPQLQAPPPGPGPTDLGTLPGPDPGLSPSPGPGPVSPSSAASQADADQAWTALGVLAEVSRQIDLNEKHDGNPQIHPQPAGTLPATVSQTAQASAVDTAIQSDATLPVQPEAVDTSGPHAVENSLTNADLVAVKVEKDPSLLQDEHAVRQTEEKLREMLRAQTASVDSSNISMAAAATARLQPKAQSQLHPALLDPQLLGEEADAAAAAATAAFTAASAARVVNAAAQAAAQAAARDANTPPTAHNQLACLVEGPNQFNHSTSSQEPHLPPTSQPWGEITYVAERWDPGPNMSDTLVVRNTIPLAKGGFRLETTATNGVKRHARARFNAARRKQVQEVRKIGACIRCRVLRKTCSQGEPCDTCRKVLSPRVWRSGCVRTKFSEQLDLYSAGVQIVMAQNRINSLKQTLVLGNHGIVIDTCHFPESEAHLRLQVLHRDGFRQEDGSAGPLASPGGDTSSPVVMVDNDVQDVPGLVEIYMRQVLHELIRRETSHFMQVTLQTALSITGGDIGAPLLRKALELWGLVEMLDRERQWRITVRRAFDPADSPPLGQVQENTDLEVFTTICLQLAAAAERKAAATSKSLLTGMQRMLQDSKVKIGFSMYLTTLILLNCVEKSTWSFKAWEQPNLRPAWPLEKDPSGFSQQGQVIADLLRMLLGIRRALPRTGRREPDGILVTDDRDPVVQQFFGAVALGYNEVKAKQRQPVFSPTDPRSCELLFCSTLLVSPDSDEFPIDAQPRHGGSIVSPGS